jgi:hypothetical protein
MGKFREVSRKNHICIKYFDLTEEKDKEIELCADSIQINDLVDLEFSRNSFEKKSFHFHGRCWNYTMAIVPSSSNAFDVNFMEQE